MAGFEGIFLNLYTFTGQFVHSSLEMVLSEWKSENQSRRLTKGLVSVVGFALITVLSMPYVSRIKRRSAGLSVNLVVSVREFALKTRLVYNRHDLLNSDPLGKD